MEKSGNSLEVQMSSFPRTFMQKNWPAASSEVWEMNKTTCLLCDTKSVAVAIDCRFPKKTLLVIPSQSYKPSNTAELEHEEWCTHENKVELVVSVQSPEGNSLPSYDIWHMQLWDAAVYLFSGNGAFFFLMLVNWLYLWCIPTLLLYCKPVTRLIVALCSFSHTRTHILFKAFVFLSGFLLTRWVAER